MMNIVLHAHVPIPNPAPSPWKTGPGCSWRLCAHRNRPNVVSLSLNLIRHQTDSSGYIVVNVEYPEIASQPVQNLNATRQLPKHPRDLRLHLPRGEPSTVIQLPLTYAPSGKKEITLKIDILMEEQPMSPTAVRDISFRTPITAALQRPPTSPSTSHQALSQARPPSSESQIHSPSPRAASISWIDERSYSSSGIRPSKDLLCFGIDDMPKCAKGQTFNTRKIGTKEVQIQPKYELKSLLCGSGLQATANHGQEMNNFSDVTLIVEREGGDDAEFYLHRSVLAMASPVFRAMFSCGMREDKTGRVVLSYFDVATVGLAVRHMYGENVADSVEQNAFGAYRFGHQFDVSSLFEVTQRVILSKMCTSTCIDVLNLSVFFDDTKLEKHASTFILEHFSELASMKETRQQLCSLPPACFLPILESDMLVATELEIFLVSMEWLSIHEGSVPVKDILRRIRWSSMTQHMFRMAMKSPLITRFPVLRNFLKSSRTTISQHLNGSKPRRRHIFDQPMVAVPVPAIRQPPAAVLYVPEVRSSDKPWSGSEFKRRNTQQLIFSSRNEKVFEYQDLAWVFRAKLSKCKALGCSHQRLSASLWLEQNDEGLVSATSRQDSVGSHSFPMKVQARCMVWNNMGGQFHHRVIDFTFQSPGWAGGWCVEDLLGDHNQTKVFLDRLSSLQEAGPVIEVALEILKCEKG